MSLVSNTRVALLANEIISGISVTIFTCGTYFTGIILKHIPSLNEYLLYFHTVEDVQLALENNDVFVLEFIGTLGIELLELAFLSFLPIMGITTLCIILVKIKQYWMDKNDVFDAE